MAGGDGTGDGGDNFVTTFDTPDSIFWEAVEKSNALAREITQALDSLESGCGINEALITTIGRYLKIMYYTEERQQILARLVGLNARLCNPQLQELLDEYTCY